MVWWNTKIYSLTSCPLRRGGGRREGDDLIYSLRADPNCLLNFSCLHGALEFYRGLVVGNRGFVHGQQKLHSCPIFGKTKSYFSQSKARLKWAWNWGSADRPSWRGGGWEMRWMTSDNHLRDLPPILIRSLSDCLEVFKNGGVRWIWFHLYFWQGDDWKLGMIFG